MADIEHCTGCQSGADLDFDFAMALQPIVDITAGRVWGYEALVRGANGEGAGTVLGRVTEANRYRFDQACRVKAIETAGRLFDRPDLRLSINFMPNAVYEPAACIRTTLASAAKVGFARDRIMFEFTEDERITGVDKIQRIVDAYRRFGFLTALDDFGAGYAGLGLLAAFQPDVIKLDMALVRDIHLSAARRAILSGLMVMARELGVTVLAEGIECAEEVEALRGFGIALMQGYVFARPLVGALPALATPLATALAA